MEQNYTTTQVFSAFGPTEEERLQIVREGDHDDCTQLVWYGLILATVYSLVYRLYFHP